jgi:hypothetical protein
MTTLLELSSDDTTLLELSSDDTTLLELSSDDTTNHHPDDRQTDSVTIATRTTAKG